MICICAALLRCCWCWANCTFLEQQKQQSSLQCIHGTVKSPHTNLSLFAVCSKMHHMPIAKMSSRDARLHCRRRRLCRFSIPFHVRFAIRRSAWRQRITRAHLSHRLIPFAQCDCSQNMMRLSSWRLVLAGVFSYFPQTRDLTRGTASLRL